MTIVAGLFLAVAGCRGGEPDGRVLLIGVDAATWDVIRPLMAEGKLPTFARLVKDGWSATLLSIEPTISPALWTTIVTGKGPGEHGIKGFLSTDGTGASGGVPVTSNLRRTEALWTIASREGRRVDVVGWYVTWPVEPVNGVMVSDRFGPEDRGPLLAKATEEAARSVYPPSRGPELERLFVRADRFLDPWEREFHRMYRAYPVDATRTAITEHLMRTAPAELTLVYLWGIDPMQHNFWGYYQPGSVPGLPLDAESVELNGGKIPEYYATVDGFIARMVALLGPRDTVLIVSDHGAGPMKEYDASAGLSGDHRIEGIVVAAGNHIRQGVAPAPVSILDVTPTVLYLLGLPIAADMEGALMRDAIVPSFLAAHPPASIPTYEQGKAAAPEAPVASPMDEAIKERLRSLGYIE
jgi:predicted AlkP superfamily phosphohydrolase/phosphomutase